MCRIDFSAHSVSSIQLCFMFPNLSELLVLFVLYSSVFLSFFMFGLKWTCVVFILPFCVFVWTSVTNCKGYLLYLYFILEWSEWGEGLLIYRMWESELISNILADIRHVQSCCTVRHSNVILNIPSSLGLCVVTLNDYKGDLRTLQKLMIELINEVMRSSYTEK